LAQVLDESPYDLHSRFGYRKEIMMDILELVPAFPHCEILSVDPPQPIEFTPISIRVAVRNPASEPFSGSVSYTGRTSEAGPSEARVNLPAGRGISELPGDQPGTPMSIVTIHGLAPQAGQNVSVQVNLFKDEPGVEFPQPIDDPSFALNIAANYRFQIDTLHCLNPRSLNNDTLKGSCKVLFGDQPLASCHPGSPLDVPRPMQYEEYGDHGTGAVLPTSFCFEGFGGVPGVAPELTIAYNFANSGFAGSLEEEMGKILDIVSDLGAGVATALVGGGSGWAIVDQAHHQANAAIFSSCDGPVAGDLITAKSDVLARLTAANGRYTETRKYTGTSSPVVCGEVSHYEVAFTFIRVSMPQ
jgi:hypothetical protein